EAARLTVGRSTADSLTPLDRRRGHALIFNDVPISLQLYWMKIVVCEIVLLYLKSFLTWIQILVF
ncbi:MAG TPA: hypothetical protein PKA44_04865, partial [Saprospiraceae bacterium]|nr:hypothetical protein [Saprospiraceae bacterium]